MFTPPPSPDDAPLVDNPTWGSIATTFLLALAMPVLLWTVTNPVAGTALIATAVVIGNALTRVAALATCLRNCGGFVLDVGDVARVTVTQPAGDSACCPT